MSFCNVANPVFRVAGTTFVRNNAPNTLAKPGETGLMLDALVVETTWAGAAIAVTMVKAIG